MLRYEISSSARTFSYCASLLIGVALVLWFSAGETVSGQSSKVILAPTVSPETTYRTFYGTNTGAIPDGLAGTPPQYGAPRTINFAVSGVNGPLTQVSVAMYLDHPFCGDVDVVLAAPGGTPSMVVVSRIGVTTAGSFGDSSNYGSTNWDDPYIFTDITQFGTPIWTSATHASCGDTCNIFTDTNTPYRTTQPGQAGQTNPPPFTSLNATFGGLTPAQANGTWTLTFRDAAASNTGTVSAASLTVDPVFQGAPTDAPVDFNGDFKTDYVVIRNVGGGASGQIRWFYNLNGSVSATVAKDWGLNGDFFIPEDFDNDNKDDIAVWRGGAAGVAAFYVLRSSDNTALIDVFGQTNDDPSVVDDYNGDGFADFAVYRGGTTSGAQSTWFYRTTPGGPVTYVNWGLNGDFVMPGDIDGNGSADFTIQRGGGFPAKFWTMLSDGTVLPVVFFGDSTDQIVPGDYDGDGKTDLAIIRSMGGEINWWWRRSSDGVIISFVRFGISATDFPVPGDYDGDGQVEPAIFRPSATPNGSRFWSLNSTNGLATVFTIGSNGDYPVANYNVH